MEIYKDADTWDQDKFLKGGCKFEKKINIFKMGFKILVILKS